MERTTVYLPFELKRALERTARARGESEAELIREGIAFVTRTAPPPQPQLPLFESGVSDLADQVDEALRGFGEQ
ncbi:MAG: CopG family transcriptional regulator [Candidatus Limnocylindrales bacterium]